MGRKRAWGTIALFLVTVQTLGYAQAQMNKAALDRLVDAAEKAHSDALVVWQNGRQVGEWYFGKKPGKIEAMSATKSVVNLAIGRLVTEGKIKSLDQPVYDFYPEWKQGRKKNITIRHLLNHTSGLQNFPRTDLEIYPSPDFVQLALAAELTSDPGTVFAYNNKAVNLLAGIVQKASGRRMDLYIGEEIFRPLGITDYSWTLDKAGNPHAMSGLQIRPADFAKLGQLVLNRGSWDNQQIIAESWFDASLRPGQQFDPTCGLLWWLGSEQTTYVVDDDFLHGLTARGAKPEFVAKYQAVKGKYENPEMLRAALRKAFGGFSELDFASNLAGSRPAKTELGPITSYSARGYLGQYLVIVPKAQLVVVRMFRGPGDEGDPSSMANIDALVRDLAQ